MKIVVGCILGKLLVTALQGCGSGDSSSPTLDSSPSPAAQSPIDPNLTVPVQPAFAQIVNNGFSQPFTISGWIDNSTAVNPVHITPITGNAFLTLGAGTGTSLCGFAVLAATQIVTGTTVANGIPTPFSATAIVYYRSDNTTVATNAAGEFFLYLPYNLPATVRAGDSGTTGSFACFTRQDRDLWCIPAGGSGPATLVATEAPFVSGL